MMSIREGSLTAWEKLHTTFVDKYYPHNIDVFSYYCCFGCAACYYGCSKSLLSSQKGEIIRLYAFSHCDDNDIYLFVGGGGLLDYAYIN